MPTISSMVISAAPLAASMSFSIRSLMLRTWSGLLPNAAARMVGVKMPMPYVPRSCRNHGTEARIVARRLRRANSAKKLCAAAVAVRRPAVSRDSAMSRRVLRLADQQSLRLGFRAVDRAANMQPVRAFRDEEAADGYQQRRNDRGAVHPAPCVERRNDREHEEAHAGAAERAQRLEAERGQHQLASAAAGDAFGDDHVRGRVVAAERDAEAEQADHQRNEVGARISSTRNAQKMIISTMNIRLRPK